ncbi:hypothetical protein QBC47DRAFT_226016 [Echria macrotheca]|uniref:Uncharacterized protein n=1 Tax=Echria macrotheca TaxID=438768 RepID=A0AAJ0BCJ9_9PEZI|nr:hypothetical protein QBC47DRAFT_226016 [Echria macrotheca]
MGKSAEPLPRIRYRALPPNHNHESCSGGLSGVQPCANWWPLHTNQIDPSRPTRRDPMASAPLRPGGVGASRWKMASSRLPYRGRGSVSQDQGLRKRTRRAPPLLRTGGRRSILALVIEKRFGSLTTESNPSQTGEPLLAKNHSFARFGQGTLRPIQQVGRVDEMSNAVRLADDSGRCSCCTRSRLNQDSGCVSIKRLSGATEIIPSHPHLMWPVYGYMCWLI